ncbi:MAG TPA: exodeoxyribonuclease V subunit alpha [Candidatus Saccharimonadia bacterium]|nr:exodeoxyribonuclease V subunit alpha [Candidatus Saccharimonadia bacterium]
MTLSWSGTDSAVLRDIDLAFARTLARLWPDAAAEALRVAAVASWAVQEGHGCLDLDVLRRDAGLRELLAGDSRIGAVAPDAWRVAIAAAPFAGDGAEAAPLVLERERIYLQRYFDYEREIASLLRARAPLAESSSMDGNAQKLADGARAPADRQALAIERALASPLTVICGGPGTGKTWAIARIVAQQAALRPGVRIALATPTGKAAARLTAALHDVLPGTPYEAVTIHRLLGIGRADRPPRHGPDRPLPFDAVIVDECSMVDLSLFAKLLRSLRPETALVLVGDPRQLPAVEGGAVLGELASLAAQGEAGLGACVVTLDHARRFEQSGGIATLTQAVSSGEPEATFAALHGPGISWHEAALGDDRGAFELLVRRAYAPLAHAADAGAALAALARFRVLGALRAGPYGVAGLNATAAAALGLSRGAAAYVGRPILVTENDAALGLANGDIGVVLPDADGRLVACVGDPRGAPRRFALAQLPGHETAYAMTAHKAQGSEFDEVAIVLPPEPHPLVTREWLYTAVSRARSHVHVFATPAAIEAALARRVLVMSGLRERLE